MKPIVYFQSSSGGRCAHIDQQEVRLISRGSFFLEKKFFSVNSLYWMCAAFKGDMINEAQHSVLCPTGLDFNFGDYKGSKCWKWFRFSRFAPEKIEEKGEREKKETGPLVNPYSVCGLCGLPPCSSDQIGHSKIKNAHDCEHERIRPSL